MKLRATFFKVFFAVGLVPVAMLLTGCSDDNTTDPSGSGSGTIYATAATSTNNADQYIYSLNVATGEEKQVAVGSYPFVAADGKIVCMTEAGLTEYSSDGKSSRIIVAYDGSNPTDVIYNDRFYNPRVSHDGKYVVYEGQNQFNAFFVVDRQTGALISQSGSAMLTETSFRTPSWTPDGRIVFSGLGEKKGIYIADRGMTTAERIDPDLSNPIYPQVSPDGKQIVFMNTNTLYIMNIDGTNMREVSTGLPSEYKVWWPTWSSDSKSISVFAGLASESLYSITPGNITPVDIGKQNESFRRRIYKNMQLHWVK